MLIVELEMVGFEEDEVMVFETTRVQGRIGVSGGADDRLAL